MRLPSWLSSSRSPRAQVRIGGRQPDRRKKKTTRLVLEQLEDRTVPSPLSGTGINITATEGAPFTGTVATFTDTNTTATAGDLTATIRWGDGSTSAGTIAGGSGSFAVQGSHTYAEQGSQSVSVSINGMGGVSTDLTTVSAGAISTIVPPSLSSLAGLAFDSSGNLYIANFWGTVGNKVVKVSPDGITSDFIHDYGQLGNPSALAVDSSGNLYVADSRGIFKISPDGYISSFPGGGYGPDALAFAPNGDLYVGNYGNNTVSKVTPDGVVTTFVASGLDGPVALAFDSSGNLYVANYNNSTISKVAPDGVVSTFVSSGLSYPDALAFDSGGNLYATNNNNVVNRIAPDGTVTTFASISAPNGLAFDSSGNLYVTDNLYNTVSKVSPSGVVSTFVGRGLYDPYGMVFDSSGNLYVSNAISGINGSSTCPVSKVTPNGVVSTFASGFSSPFGLAIDGSGNLYVPNFDKNTISKVTPGGVVSTFVSSGLNGPGAVAIDGSGDLFVANQDNTVSEVSPSGTVSAFVSSGLNGISGLTIDTLGNLYISSPYYGTVDKVTPNGVISTFVSGLRFPSALAIDSFGDLYVSTGDGTVRQISPDGVVTPFVGGAASGLAFDHSGNLYVADANNGTINKVTVNVTTTPTVMSTASIADAPLNATPVTFDVTPGAPVSNVTVATFTDANPAATATDFSATVAWGDGDSTAGVSIIADPQVAGQFDVLASKSHAYAGSGSVPVTVAISDAGGSTATASSTVRISVSTTTALAASANPSVLNQSVTVTATVTPAGGSGTPTGTVQFQIDGANVGAAVALSGGSASFQTSTLAVGPHTITGLYSGGGSFSASTGSLSQTVLSAQGQITSISNQVNALVTGGALSSGNGSALTAKLNSATASLNAGNSAAGVNQLNAFLNQVNAFQKAGKLSNAQAQSLVSAANLAIAAANGSGARLLQDSAATASASGDNKPVSAAGELVSGSVGVYLDSVAGPVTADEQARFDDAINTLNATFGPWGVALVDVGASDAADAIVHVQIADTSAAGGAADGVLGCTLAGQITLVTGWNWYTGTDPSAIGASQYDFETIVTHELGHAIGLGHSGDTGSVMYAYLSPGQTRRGVTTQDLSVLESGTGPAPLLAAPWHDSQDLLPPTSAAATAAEARSYHVGSNPPANLRSAPAPVAQPPMALAPAGLAGILAAASVPGDGPALGTVSPGPQAANPVPAWNQGAAGYGTWGAVGAPATSATAAGVGPETVSFSDAASVPASDQGQDTVLPPNDEAPPARKPSATQESDPVPVGLPVPPPALRADPVTLDALMEQCARHQPLADSLQVVSAGRKLSEPNRSGAAEACWLLTLAGGVAMHKGARQDNTRRSPPEHEERRPHG
jgi:sugar lactone lactonase YvrE